MMWSKHGCFCVCVHTRMCMKELYSLSGLKVLTACWNTAHSLQEAHAGNGHCIVAGSQYVPLLSTGNPAAPLVLFQSFRSVLHFTPTHTHTKARRPFAWLYLAVVFVWIGRGYFFREQFVLTHSTVPHCFLDFWISVLKACKCWSCHCVFYLLYWTKLVRQLL